MRQDEVDLGWNTNSVGPTDTISQLDEHRFVHLKSPTAYPFTKQNPFLNGDLVQISTENTADSILALEAILQESNEPNAEAWYKLGVKHQG